LQSLNLKYTSCSPEVSIGISPASTEISPSSIEIIPASIEISPASFEISPEYFKVSPFRKKVRQTTLPCCATNSQLARLFCSWLQSTTGGGRQGKRAEISVTRAFKFLIEVLL
jgi:hypothetical protein